MSGLKPYSKTFDINPNRLGLNDEVLLAGTEVTSESFSGEGRSQLTLGFYLTYAAATDVFFYLDWSPDGGNTWLTTQSGSASAGTITYKDAKHLHAIPATDDGWSCNIPIDYPLMRLRLDSTGGTTDTIKGWVRVACL